MRNNCAIHKEENKVGFELHYNRYIAYRGAIEKEVPFMVSFQ